MGRIAWELDLAQPSAGRIARVTARRSLRGWNSLASRVGQDMRLNSAHLRQVCDDNTPSLVDEVLPHWILGEAGNVRARASLGL